MDDLRRRLVDCFQTVFPDLVKDSIPAARQDAVASWDSVATITLINVIEDEFRIPFELERFAEFDSFQSIEAYVKENLAHT